MKITKEVTLTKNDFESAWLAFAWIGGVLQETVRLGAREVIHAEITCTSRLDYASVTLANPRGTEVQRWHANVSYLENIDDDPAKIENLEL